MKRFELKAPYSRTPDREFERQWALTVIDRVLENLREDAERANKVSEFERLKPFLTDTTPQGSYREIGERLGLTEGAVKVAVHRLRQRFGRALRTEIAATVNDEADVDAEIRYLFDALAP